MKKLFNFLNIIILSLTFLVIFYSKSLSNDIKDFTIEELSIGESLLDFYSKKEIKDSISFNDQYPKDDFKIAWFNKYKNGNTFLEYDGVTIYIKNNDEFIIYGLVGSVYFKKNFSRCLKLKDKVIDDLENFLKISFGKEIKKKLFNSEDNTMMYGNVFEFDNNDRIQITCYDWSDEEEDKGRIDELGVVIADKDYNKWMDSISNLY